MTIGTKIIIAVLGVFSTSVSVAQKDTVVSRVYTWSSLEVKKDSSRDRSQVLEGSTSHLANLEIHASTLDPGKAPHPPHAHTDTEELVIVKEGNLKVTVKGITKVVGPGSVVMAMPNDEHGFQNAGTTKATYYVIKLKSKSPIDLARGIKEGGSFIIDWNDVKVEKTDKGEKRQVVNRATSQFTKFEMHVTTLNKGEISHLPHTHFEEEIILLKKGEVQMQIGNNFYKAVPGDLIYLSSGILHALKNTGNGECTYFAFQWK